ncbi:MAG: glycoside hydrolase family 13 protein [Ruminococcaceae bacterium]|nr:glycoside hydrolase family 13 protein [Oscillospiraceae bacterium]
MLPKLFCEIDKTADIQIRKFAEDTDVSALGAFEYGTVVDFELAVSRCMGMTTPVLRICRDGQPSKDIPMNFKGSDNVSDMYCLCIDTKELCGEAECGLFYYEFVLVRGANTVYTDAYNNVDFRLSEKEGVKFRLLVYEKGFKTPDSFKGVMYQIFPDRFFRGESEEAKSVPVREDAILNKDWENGIPQFALKVGDPLKNNMFFGGTLWGIAEKLDYLCELGVSIIYLCPIFEAYSNHKYDTGNYLKVDDMFGGDDALKNLIDKAKEKGISIVLDGVFNHTGDDSIYFNKYRRYGDGGAYNDPDSPYVKWYNFKNHPDEYESWWGIEILPRLDHSNDNCRKFFTGEGGVIQKYIDMGIGGWRLDVADELCDEFLDELRDRAKSASNGEAVIIGEVWENAAEKSAYGKRRRYFQGRQLDSVMNYPLRSAIIDFCVFGDAEILYNTLTEIYSSYPVHVSNKLMNIIGTHDTERILTVLGRDMGDEDRSMAELSVAKLSPKQRKKGVELLKIAAGLQYTVYGVPSLYYGDEIGLEGYRDPFCRMPFPWHELDDAQRAEILDFYKALGRIRRTEPALDDGLFCIIGRSEDFICFFREKQDSKLLIAANRGGEKSIDIPDGCYYIDLISNKEYTGNVTVPGDTIAIFKEVQQ